MATRNRITSSQKRGAEAALEALRELDAINVLEKSLEEFDALRAQAMGVLRRHAESEFGEGFLTVIAEYIDECNWCDPPNLDIWKPTLLKSNAEFAKYRRGLVKTYSGDE